MPSTLLVVFLMMTGGMLGAAVGVRWLASFSDERLHTAVRTLLVFVGVLLIIEAALPWTSSGVPVGPMGQGMVALCAGPFIGAVSALLGVAGGELIIPTLVLFFGADQDGGYDQFAHQHPDHSGWPCQAPREGCVPGHVRGTALGCADGPGNGGGKCSGWSVGYLRASQRGQGVAGCRADRVGAAPLQDTDVERAIDIVGA